jgi:hypothetical protein
MRASGFFSLALAAVSLACAACSSSSDAPTDVQGTGGGDVTITHPDAPPLAGQTACTVVETIDIPEPDFEHIDPCTPITYASPPSGGDHWPIWALYEEHTDVVPREMYVHNLEHGAIVFTYACDGCDDVRDAYRAEIATIADPLCLQTVGPVARVLTTPDPLLDTPMALSAWGATYTATCVDPPSIHAFVLAHYGNGREPLCNEGEAAPSCD